MICLITVGRKGATQHLSADRVEIGDVSGGELDQFGANARGDTNAVEIGSDAGG